MTARPHGANFLERERARSTQDMSASLNSCRGNTLFLLAHNDDEFFVLPRIEAEIASGSNITIIFTTDGAAYGESPDRRLGETLKALAKYGLTREHIMPLGTKLGIRDGTSHLSIDDLWQALNTMPQVTDVVRIYTPAWEGGHVDHDTAHLLSIALARQCSATVHEFSLYHGYKVRPPFFRCMSLIPASTALHFDKCTWTQAISWLFTCRHYHSQRRAFLGLIGFCLPQILGRRSLVTREAGGYDYFARAHDGPLFYETRFKVPHAVFHSNTGRFIRKHLLEGEPLQATAY